jgi:glycolate oxidase FAD binding subunit
MTDALLRRLEEMLGPGTVLAGEAAAWASSESHPRAVVCPASDEEVGEVLVRASREGWTVVPAGAGRWLTGGNPVDADVVLSTQRMDRVTEYEPADLTLTAGAGTRLDTIREATGAHGQWLALDPPGGGPGSLGALVATGGAGPLRLAFGTPRDHVLGLTLVAGDGRILRLGGRVVKNVAGFDLTRLAIGSWGTLGIVTSVSLRLFPLPESEVTLLFDADRAESLGEAARAVATSPLPVGALELVEDAGLHNALYRDPAGGEAFLAVRLLGSRTDLAEMERRIREMLPSGSPRRLENRESRQLHETLDDREIAGSLILRLSLLPSSLETLLERTRIFLTSIGIEGSQARMAIHVGAGILRLTLGLGEKLVERDQGDLADSLLELRQSLEGLGGTLTVSQGPPSLVREVGAWGDPRDVASLMAGLRHEFDPAGVLAPGRFVS